MGLLGFLRRLLGLGETDASTPGGVAAVATPPGGALPLHAPTAPVRLKPLRYASSLVRTDPQNERTSEVLPYRFAHLAVDGSGYLDLSKDGDPRWLAHFHLRELTTPEDLAAFFNLKLGRLAWLTHRFDEGGRPARERDAHYHFHWLRKRQGGHRLIESPKQTLRDVQQQILREILDKVPPHPAAHGFVRGRSIKTNAAPHVGRRVLLKIDLQNFYPSVKYSRVVAIFRSLGYPREIALWLARLTTSAIPAGIAFPEGDAAAVRTYTPRHLPQGACTSPALANLSAFALDTRLAGLARAYDVEYTRYADDMTFSGSGRFIPALKEFIPLASAIIRDERFTVHRSKRKVVRSNQRQMVAGVVVNARPNISRQQYDVLKAILHNCVRHGPASQNRQQHPEFAAHLLGRIAHVSHLNAARGAKLRTLYEKIDWSR
jgi:RNA-directed DNA polymerase